MAFEKDSANTRKVTGTDAQGVDLDGQVRNTVWDVGTTAWVRAEPGFPSGAVITSVVSGTVTAISGAQVTSTVNIAGSVVLSITGTVNTVGGSGQATVNINGFPTVNLGAWPTLNVGNTVLATVTGTTTLGTIPTVNLGSIGTVGVGSMPTINVGNTVTIAGTATVNIGTAIPSGPNIIGQVTGRAAITNPTAVSDAAAVQFMMDKLGRTIVSRAPQDLNESVSVNLSSSANTQLLAGFSGLKHYIGTIGATMTFSVAGPTTLRIKDGGPSGALIWAWTFTGANPNMTPLDIDPVYANTTASFQVTADITASTAGLMILMTGFRSP